MFENLHNNWKIWKLNLKMISFPDWQKVTISPGPNLIVSIASVFFLALLKIFNPKYPPFVPVWKIMQSRITYELFYLYVFIYYKKNIFGLFWFGFSARFIKGKVNKTVTHNHVLGVTVLPSISTCQNFSIS